MDEDRLARTGRDLGGKVQAGVGRDVRMQVDVVANQLAGAALEL